MQTPFLASNQQVVLQFYQSEHPKATKQPVVMTRLENLEVMITLTQPPRQSRAPWGFSVTPTGIVSVEDDRLSTSPEGN